MSAHEAFEQLAAKLETSAEYRVLRRLRPLQTPQPPLAGARRCAKVAFVDCETTGLDPTEDKIIDVGVLCVEIDVQTGQLARVLGNWSGLQDPGIPIPPNITALTGISDTMVAGQSFDEPSLLAIMDATDLVVAHNASFDRPFFEGAFAWFERFPWACSHRLVRWQEEGFGSTKLEFLAFRTGLFYEGHRALVDCHALATVLFSLVLPSTGENALCKVLDTFEAPVFVLNANGAPFEAKDLLKLRGYRWDGEDRIWRLKLDEPVLQEELDWLRANVYTHKSARVQVETRDSLVAYSARQGRLEWRSIGPQGDSGRTFAASGRRHPG